MALEREEEVLRMLGLEEVLEIRMDLKSQSWLANDKDSVTAGMNDSDNAGRRVEERKDTGKSSVRI